MTREPNIQRVFRHSDLGTYSAEASDLGLAPGDWPTTMAAVLDDGRPVLLIGTGEFGRDLDGELLYVVYRPAESSGIKATFKVWND